MRRIVVIVLVLGIAVWAAYHVKRPVIMYTPWGTAAELSPTPAVTPNTIGGYQYAYWHVQDIENLRLIPNYSARLDLDQLGNDNACFMGINGGFYSETNVPLGLVVSDGRVVHQYRANALFNGLVAVGNGTVYVGDYREGAYTQAVQSGPVLTRAGVSVDLGLSRDKAARRMVATQDATGVVRFLAVYTDKDSVTGPYLDELPGIVMAIATENSWPAITAVNLDGGSAAGFNNGIIKLEDWQPVGSWWCQALTIQ